MSDDFEAKDGLRHRHGGAGPRDSPAQQGSNATFSGGLIRYAEEARPRPQPAPKPLGLHELSTPVVYRAALLEFVGTFFFVVASISIVLAAGNAGNPPLAVGVGHAVLLFLFILATAAPSGGHLNPSITIATVTTGMTSVTRGVLYVIAQTTGSVLGSLVMRGIIGKDEAKATGLGKCSAGDLDDGPLLLSEIAFTFILLFISYGIAFDERQGQIFGPILAPLLIGVTLGGIIWATSALSPGYTGPGMNAARCFGPDVALGDVQQQQWVWWVGPFIACVLHAGLYYLAPPHHKADYETKWSKTEVQLSAALAPAKSA